MIRVIGVKMIALLGLLLALGGILFFVNSFYLEARIKETTQKLNGVRAESADLRTKTEALQADYDSYQKEQETFSQISRMGFFNTQDRVEARRKFEAIERLSKIMFARYEIRAATILKSENKIENPVLVDLLGAQPTADYVIIESPVSVSLSAIDDVDIYRFIYYMNYGFPGHVTLNQLNITKTEKLTPDILKDIGLGNPKELVSANISLTWRTMIEKSVADTLSDLRVLNAGGAQ